MVYYIKYSNIEIKENNSPQIRIVHEKNAKKVWLDFNKWLERKHLGHLISLYMLPAEWIEKVNVHFFLIDCKEIKCS